MTTEQEAYERSLWYAFGRIDSGAYPSLSPSDAYGYADRRRSRQGEYNRKEVYFMPSLISAWDEYVAEMGNRE